MAIIGNFKGTTQSEFRIGKGTGNAIRTGDPTAGSPDIGDVLIDSANLSLQVFEGNVWQSVGATLTDLNVDAGTLFVDTANDTVSIGSTSSTERLFVNGSMQLGTNPAIKYSGAFLDFQHVNGTGTVMRVRDNNTGTDPVFKIYNANNQSEVFRVDGAVTIGSSYTLPTTDGVAGQALVTDGSGNVSFADLETGEPIEDYGLITEAAATVRDYGSVDTDTRRVVSHDSFLVAELAELAAVPGDMVFVADETGGATMAFYDGNDWRRIQDRAVVA